MIEIVLGDFIQHAIKRIVYLRTVIKRYSPLLFMLFAQAILLGHNFTPHFHDNDHHSSGHHHKLSNHHHTDGHGHSNEHHHDSKSNIPNDFTNIFSEFQHDENGNTYVGGYKYNFADSKQLTVFTVLVTDIFRTQNLNPAIRQHPPPFKPIFISSPQIFIAGLRAPPILIV